MVGSGNETINAKDKVRGTVGCGEGGDEVSADKRYRLRGCERVRR